MFYLTMSNEEDESTVCRVCDNSNIESSIPEEMGEQCPECGAEMQPQSGCFLCPVCGHTPCK